MIKQLNPFWWLGVAYARINYKLNFRRFRSECQRAEHLSNEKNGMRFRVFKVSSNRYKALSGENINYLRNRKLVKKNADLSGLSKNCLYDTLTHSNLHPVYLNVDLKLRDRNFKLIKSAKKMEDK